MSRSMFVTHQLKARNKANLPQTCRTKKTQMIEAHAALSPHSLIFFSFVICCMRLYYVLSSLLLHARSNKTLSAPVCYRLLIGIRSLDGGERRDDDSGTSKNGVTTTSTTTLIIPFYLPLPRCFSAFHFPFINHNLLRHHTLRHASSAYRG